MPITGQTLHKWSYEWDEEAWKVLCQLGYPKDPATRALGYQKIALKILRKKFGNILEGNWGRHARRIRWEQWQVAHPNHPRPEPPGITPSPWYRWKERAAKEQNKEAQAKVPAARRETQGQLVTLELEARICKLEERSAATEKILCNLAELVVKGFIALGCSEEQLGLNKGT